jgi:hypothetical protein
MLARLTATKEAFELKSIEIINNRNRGFVVKKDNDFKGIHFDLVWERLDQDSFKLVCLHKGTFNVATQEFKSLVEEEPESIIPTIMFKELFTAIYTSDLLAKAKDTVYTEELKFKYIDLFEEEEVMHFYVSKLAEVFSWELQVQNPDTYIWERFTI